MMDVEFSHPIKAIGEIFEVAAKAFRVDVVGKEVTDVEESTFARQIEPSLEYGSSPFYHAVVKVRALVVLRDSHSALVVFVYDRRPDCRGPVA